METFIGRLINESDELRKKIYKLQVFQVSKSFSDIDPIQRSLLKIQLEAMHTYSQCLIERIDILAKK